MGRVKTTVEIDDDLFRISRKCAIDEGRTFRAVLHDALRVYINMGDDKKAHPPNEDEERVELRRSLEAFRVQVAAAEFWSVVQDRSRWEEETRTWVEEFESRAAARTKSFPQNNIAAGHVALDTDILLKAFSEEDAAADGLRALLARRAVRGTVFAIPLFCLSGFLRTATDISRPSRVPPIRALAWMDRLVPDRAVLLVPDADYWPTLKMQSASASWGAWSPPCAGSGESPRSGRRTPCSIGSRA
jgi:hypothetical protein